MNTQEQPPSDFHRQKVDALEDIEEQLQRIADEDVPFSPRAQAALDWLNEQRESQDGDANA